MAFGKGFKEKTGDAIKRRLYAKLTRDNAPTHCANGHKHKTTNCRSDGGDIICNICNPPETNPNFP